MVEYKIKDFKKWLNQKPERKRGRSEKGWEDTFCLIKNDDNEWKIDEESCEIHLKNDEILFYYYEAFKEWKNEVDQAERERERERESKTKLKI